VKIERVGELMIAEIDTLNGADILRVAPGDILAFKTNCELDFDAVDRATDFLESLVPDGVKVVVLSGGDNFQVVRPE